MLNQIIMNARLRLLLTFLASAAFLASSSRHHASEWMELPPERLPTVTALEPYRPLSGLVCHTDGENFSLAWFDHAGLTNAYIAPVSANPTIPILPFVAAEYVVPPFAPYNYSFFEDRHVFSVQSRYPHAGANTIYLFSTGSGRSHRSEPPIFAPRTVLGTNVVVRCNGRTTLIRYRKSNAPVFRLVSEEGVPSIEYPMGQEPTLTAVLPIPTGYVFVYLNTLLIIGNDASIIAHHQSSTQIRAAANDHSLLVLGSREASILDFTGRLHHRGSHNLSSATQLYGCGSEWTSLSEQANQLRIDQIRLLNGNLSFSTTNLFLNLPTGQRQIALNRHAHGIAAVATSTGVYLQHFSASGSVSEVRHVPRSPVEKLHTATYDASGSTYIYSSGVSNTVFRISTLSSNLVADSAFHTNTAFPWVIGESPLGTATHAVSGSKDLILLRSQRLGWIRNRHEPFGEWVPISGLNLTNVAQILPGTNGFLVVLGQGTSVASLTFEGHPTGGNSQSVPSSHFAALSGEVWGVRSVNSGLGVQKFSQQYGANPTILWRSAAVKENWRLTAGGELLLATWEETAGLALVRQLRAATYNPVSGAFSAALTLMNIYDGASYSTAGNKSGFLIAGRDGVGTNSAVHPRDFTIVIPPSGTNIVVRLTTGDHGLAMPATIAALEHDFLLFESRTDASFHIVRRPIMPASSIPAFINPVAHAGSIEVTADVERVSILESSTDLSAWRPVREIAAGASIPIGSEPATFFRIVTPLQ